VPTAPSNNQYQAGFAAAMMLKDLNLAQEASGSAECQTPMGKRAAELYTEMAEKGQGELDFSGIIKMLQGAF
jgi:3-hydroxyisobutyrate dehydrogenase